MLCQDPEEAPTEEALVEVHAVAVVHMAAAREAVLVEAHTVAAREAVLAIDRTDRSTEAECTDTHITDTEEAEDAWAVLWVC